METIARPVNHAVFERLVQGAREQEPVSYGELGNMLGLAMDYPPHRTEIGQLLGAISRHEVANGRPMLSSVVLHKDEATPGKGFFTLGQELGLVGPDEDELAFSIRQLKETFALWGSPDAPSTDEALGILPAAPEDASGRAGGLPDAAGVLSGADARASGGQSRVQEDLAAEEPASAMQPLVGNRAVEDAAIRWVMQLEQAAGRQPVDRRYEAGFAADLESSPRIIEVKAIGGSGRGWFLPVENAQMEEARRNPNFYIYVVENTRQGDPTQFTLRILGGERLQGLLAKAKQRSYYEVPWPFASYDATPGLDALSEPTDRQYNA